MHNLDSLLNSIEVVDDAKIESLDREKERADKEKKVIKYRDAFFNSGAIVSKTFGTFDRDKWVLGFDLAKSLVDSDKNGLFVGRSRCGKSHLASAVGWEFVARGLSVYRLVETELYGAWRKSTNFKSSLLDDMIDKAKSCSVLIYDELGKNRLTDSKIGVDDSDGEYYSSFGNVVAQIADYRADHDKITIATTQSSNYDAFLFRVGYSIVARFKRIDQTGDNNCITIVYAGD